MTDGERDLRLDGLGDGTNLVDLEQETVASLLLNGSLDTDGVGDSQIITDDLDARLGGKVGPCLPVILVERILNGDNGVVLDVLEVDIGELGTSNPLGRIRVGVLEVQIVLAVLVELGGGDVESNLDLALVAGLFDSLRQEFQGLIGTGDVGSKSTLVTDVDS